MLDLETIEEAVAYVQSLEGETHGTIQTWIITQGLLFGLYYVLLFMAVFLLGRRIIQAAVAAYREARAQSV